MLKNKHDVYRSKDCMKKIYESLKEHAMEIFNFEKKKFIPLTDKQRKSYALRSMSLHR